VSDAPNPTGRTIPPSGPAPESPDELSRREIQEATEMADLTAAKRVTRLYER